ncbi:MAG TPA: HDOD domain-containing protein [Opitutus sp.]|nr:HDOD domain-containing protein [Opitutus sp.]
MIVTSISREMLLHVVKTLPAAPRIMSQLGHLLLDPNSDMGEITDLLRRDTALTARIIRISNSAFYNTGAPTGSLDEALARVGYTEVYRLVGLAAVAQMSDHALPLYGTSGACARENALLTALIIENLADAAQLDPRVAYTAGLLRSVGKIALDRLTPNGPGSLRYRGRESGRLGDWEFDHLGVNNCDAAATILREWRFPTATVEAIRDHYLRARTASPFAQLLNLAAGAAERGGHPFPGETDYWVSLPLASGPLEIGEQELSDALFRALEHFGPLREAIAATTAVEKQHVG